MTIYNKGSQKEPSIRIIIAKPKEDSLEVILLISNARELYNHLGEEFIFHEKHSSIKQFGIEFDKNFDSSSHI